ncbi:MAG: nucleoside triphosphate pyrophosphohydrolase [Deltaproteobacteria bacterium]|nr:nucleoside triphosphate pyrophosphohydrolase [Deltaproteobacteria bacterium]
MDDRRLAQAVKRLADLVSRLRGPGGCPWDAQQTEESIRMYLLEEAYEVLDAVERGSSEELCGELGDLLFQILFLARLSEEKGAFDLVDVMDRITGKMIRRHPHVFGSASLDTPDEVAESWARIKREEKGEEEAGAGLGDIPDGLPALLRAHRLIQRAAAAEGAGVPREGRRDIEQGFERLKSALEREDRDGLEERIGEMLFSLAGLAGRCGLNAEDVLRKANRRFAERAGS